MWLWLAPLLLLAIIALGLLGLHVRILRKYLPFAVRVFQEKPLFIIPFGKPSPEAQDISITTASGLKLQGCHLPARKPRKGVILFGLEFGSNRWTAISYCEFLRENGYDIFAFETRGQGQSPAQAGYEPLQWVTQFEIEDFRAAVDYLKSRPDADDRGIGLFGLSKGAGAGLFAAADDPWIRCFVTDGVFGSLTTMVPYMKKWILIVSRRERLARNIPTWYYRYAAQLALRRVERERRCKFVHLEDALPRLAPRPWLLIHGGEDNYITPDMAQALFACARQPKEYWLVEGAKHNQAFQVATDEYKRRVLTFFEQHLAPAGPMRPTQNGHQTKESQPVASVLPRP